jgi:hypothetical protein
VKSLGFFKPRETHTKTQSSYFILFFKFFVTKIRWKVPHENKYGEASILENFQKNPKSPHFEEGKKKVLKSSHFEEKKKKVLKSLRFVEVWPDSKLSSFETRL